MRPIRGTYTTCGPCYEGSRREQRAYLEQIFVLRYLRPVDAASLTRKRRITRDGLFATWHGWVGFEEGDGGGEDGGRAFAGGEVAAVWNGDESGVGNTVLHGFADGDGDEPIFGTPDDESGLGDVGEAVIEQIAAGFHGVHALLNDGAVPGNFAECGADDERWEGSRVRRQDRHEELEAGEVVRDGGGAGE